MLLITGIIILNKSTGKEYPKKKVHIYVRNKSELDALRKIHTFNFTVLYDTGKEQKEPDKVEVFYTTTENLKMLIQKGTIRDLDYNKLI